MSEVYATERAIAMSDRELFAHLDRTFRARDKVFPAERFETTHTEGRVGKLALSIVAPPSEAPKATVVFMPGTNAYALLYAELLVALADRGYLVVGFDPRGHGRSAGARGSYTVPELVDDMRSVCGYARKRNGLPLFVAGSSQGGITAFYTATTPEPLAGAICHNLADLSDPRSVACTRLPEFTRHLAPLLRAAARVRPEQHVPLNAYLDLAKEEVAGVGDAWQLIQQDPLLVPYIRLRTLASLSCAPPPAPPERMTTPVVVLHGERDGIFPRWYVDEVYRRVASNKEWILVPGAPHYMIVDCVEGYLPPLVRWLDARVDAVDSNGSAR